MHLSFNKKNLLVMLLSSYVASSDARLLEAPERTLESVDLCVERLEHVRPKLPKSSLKYICKRSDVDCVVKVAQAHPHWDSFSLVNACETESGKQFDETCHERADTYFDLGPNTLGNLCRDSKSECVLTYKEARPDVGFAVSKSACLGINHTCPAQMARTVEGMNWESSQHHQACEKSLSPACPLEYLRAMREQGRRTTPTLIGLACKYLENTCPAFLVDHEKNWSPTVLNEVCRKTDFQCVQENINGPKASSARKLIKLCLKKQLDNLER